jgi:ACS family tartrate transporter-like MFS transporter
LIIMGIPIASVIGGPISGFILDHAHWYGLSSWRWLFVLEGIPAIVCAPLTYFLLPDPSPAPPSAAGRLTLTPRVWHLAGIGFCHGFATYTFNFWLPQILKAVLGGPSNTAVGLAVMIPNLAGLIAMVLVSRYSDRTLERRLFMVPSAAVAGFAMLLLGVPHSPVWTIVLFSAVAMGAYSFLPVFFAVPGEFLSGVSAAVGIAVVTSIANLGGFVGPYTVGLIRQATGSPYDGLVCAGTFFLLAATLASVPAWQLGNRARATDPAG